MKTRYGILSAIAALTLSGAGFSAGAQEVDSVRIERQRVALEKAWQDVARLQQHKGAERLKTRNLRLQDPKSDDEYRNNPLPDDLTFHSVTWDGKQYIARFEGSFHRSLDRNNTGFEALAEFQNGLLVAEIARVGVTEQVRIEVRLPETEEFVPLMPEMSPAELEKFRKAEAEFAARALAKIRVGAMQPRVRSKKLPYGGALTGKKVLVSGGHGWTQGTVIGWSSTSFGWQRGLCGFSDTRGIIEDTSNAMMVNQYLIPLLQNMGAEVVLVRESDMNSDGESIIDNGDEGYSEEGTFATNTQTSGDKRFRFGADFRHSGINGAKATWSKTFGTSGWRDIQVWYPEGADRASEVKYTITDGGGEHAVYVNQQQYGRYRDLGRYWCVAGVPCTVTVERTSDSGELIADAVKFSSGRENISPAKVPWWQMEAWYYLHRAIYGDSVLPANSSRGVVERRNMANSAGADIYISVHSNATNKECASGGDVVNGFWVYTHKNKQTGTALYADLVYKASMDSIHDSYDPNYCPLGIHQESLGELAGQMPSVLVEMAYHNNLQPPRACPATGMTPARTDVEALQHPLFREAVARGIADGIAQYFAIQANGGSGSYVKGAGLPPDRPQKLYAANGDSPCNLTVSWDPVPGAQGYKLYMIDNLRPGYERAWNEGTDVNETSVTLTQLTPGRVYAFKVAALNKNGEGYASPAVTARVRGKDHKTGGLYINGYTRRDARINLEDNDMQYAAEHGIALGSVGEDFYFDGALMDAAESGNVDFSKYRVLDFQAGRNSGDSGVLSQDLQNKLREYIRSGGKLLISGSEIGWALSHKNQGKDFFNNVLKATFTNTQDDAGTFGLKGTGDFARLGDMQFDDGNHGTYRVLYPDFFSANGSTAVLNYDKGQIAGLASDQVILFGFPVETVYPADARAKLVGCSIAKLLNGAACAPQSHALSDDGALASSCEEAPECTANDNQCADGNTAKQCTDGRWQSVACGEGKHCDKGQCVDNVQVDPTEPGDPGDPTDPTEPGDPGDPADPTEPGDPNTKPADCNDGESHCDGGKLVTCHSKAWHRNACPENEICVESDGKASCKSGDGDSVKPDQRVKQEDSCSLNNISKPAGNAPVIMVALGLLGLMGIRRRKSHGR